MACILPYIEQDNLWRQTEAMEQPGSLPAPCSGAYGNPLEDIYYPWDVCSNGFQRYTALAQVMPTFSCPSDGRDLQQNTSEGLTVAFTAYEGVSGPDLTAWSVGNPGTYNGSPTSAVPNDDLPGFLVPWSKFSWAEGTRDGYLANKGRRMGDITDGTSNTLAVGERPAGATLDFGWWFAGAGQAGLGVCDVILGTNEINLQTAGIAAVDACPVGPYQFQAGQINNPCDQFHYWSLHSGGSNFLFCDASVHFLSYGAASVMPQLATVAGGEVVQLP
jgi:prepilin-type processing-associated H-X9-DG protein